MVFKKKKCPPYGQCGTQDLHVSLPVALVFDLQIDVWIQLVSANVGSYLVLKMSQIDTRKDKNWGINFLEFQKERTRGLQKI